MAMDRKKRNRLIIGFLVFDLIIVVAILSMPKEKRDELFNTAEDAVENTERSELKDYAVIEKVTSRRAVIGDDWVIKGRVLNEHDSLDFSHFKLMFNFSDGVETISYEEEIQARNTVGFKFKERISGHKDADFESVEVLEARE